MRILHTADWHIGQTLNGWSRETEHRAFLDRLHDLILSEDVDVLLVAGDVFDGANRVKRALGEPLSHALAANKILQFGRTQRFENPIKNQREVRKNLSA